MAVMAAVQRAAGARASTACGIQSLRANGGPTTSARAIAPASCKGKVLGRAQPCASALGSRRSLAGEPLPQVAALPRLPALSRRAGAGIRAEAAAAAAPAGGPASAPPAKWEGAKMQPLAISVAVGVITWFLPAPAGVPRNAWQLLAIFLGTVVAIITQPLPLGAVALIGLGVSILTRTLTFAAAFSAFGNEIPWLIALAFFFAKGFIKTGLGNRVAYQFVKLFGSTTLGLSYSLVFAEALLAPAIPSVSARAGGIFLPLVKAMCIACGSKVGDGTERRLGAYLMTTCFQTSVVSSAMFLTAMAANPLSVNLTASVIGQTISWTTWASAAIVPGLLSLLLVPAILFWVYPPEVKESPDAPLLAQENLEKMGPMKQNEQIMAGTLLVTVSTTAGDGKGRTGGCRPSLFGQQNWQKS